MKARSHRRRSAALVAGLLVFAQLAVAQAAPGQVLQNPQAAEHFSRAQEHFDEEDYAGAIPELKAAYALEPNPMLLYAWGQAERLAGSCARAVELYRRFLDTGPSAEPRQLAEANLVDCEAEVPSSTADTSEVASTDDDASDVIADDGVDEPRPRHWIADPVGGVLTGVGVATVIAGGAVMGIARQRGSEAPDMFLEDNYRDARANALQLNTAGVVTLAIGSALVLGGVIRYAVIATKRRSGSAERRQARLAPTFTGTGFGLWGRF